jgi:hypothetical protein
MNVLSFHWEEEVFIHPIIISLSIDPTRDHTGEFVRQPQQRRRGKEEGQT